MATQKLPTPDRSDVVWIRHHPKVGREMKGMHPTVALSPKAFVERTGLVIGLPLTHADFNADNPFAIAMVAPGKEGGYVLCHQPQSFDWQLRGGGKHPCGVSPKPTLREALDRSDTI